MGKRCCCSVYLEKEEILSDHRAAVMVVVASSSVTLETDCSFAVGRHLASNYYPLKVKNCSVPLTKVQIVVLGCRWVKCVSAGKDPLSANQSSCHQETLNSGIPQATSRQEWKIGLCHLWSALLDISSAAFCFAWSVTIGRAEVKMCSYQLWKISPKKINRFKIPGCEKITSKTMQSVQKRRLRSGCITNDVTSGMSRHWTGCWYLNELSHALLLTKSTALP
ncbi:hypothetical protein T07_7133 [Trichinella nelsoni]|uniref:Uncharacterized protein n=1 Tax=Trichinella nelsoni TaxID=6336 RepID=A0A0V0S3C7_9BILA|nr:hypothetical protein T07_7133 [Trichinella nelsoni]